MKCKLRIPPPMTSTERVRAFRERNPGYDRKRMARYRAMINSGAARILAELAATQAAEQTAVAVKQIAAPAKPMLMLPAPVVDPAMEAINALSASLKARSAQGETSSIAVAR